MKQRSRNPRSGFTIVELLVVIAILALLMGMVAAALFPSVNRQHRQNTRAMLKKLDQLVIQQWTEAMKQAQKTQVPSELLAMAGHPSNPNAASIAKAIWVKLQMRAEFPMSYDEVYNPWRTFLLNATTSAWIPTSNQGAETIQRSLTYYQRALGGRAAANNPATESAALLLLALQKPRGGKMVKMEETLGPTAIKDTDNDGMREIVDSWGVAVSFLRWNSGNAEMDALNTTARGRYDRDKEDIDHALMDQVWNATPVPHAGVPLFEGVCHAIRVVPPPGSERWSWYTEPTILSAGKDGNFATNDDNLYSFKQR